ncbi:hypothetical protein, partial [Ralstonia pseudosolanacearum]|uniref:hypothetical protein n=1 Tax=Ralstonia pseudosolanacearum TaxID=1310165 RepID=UPI003221E68B
STARACGSFEHYPKELMWVDTTGACVGTAVRVEHAPSSVSAASTSGPRTRAKEKAWVAMRFSS